MSSIFYQGVFFLFVLLVLAIPLGWYIKEIMQGKIPKGIRFLQPIEDLFYRVIGPISKKEMSAKCSETQKLDLIPTGFSSRYFYAVIRCRYCTGLQPSFILIR